MRKIVIVNQAFNYLSIGIANEFNKQYNHVAIITGSIHAQGEELDDDIEINMINQYSDANPLNRIINWILATLWVYKIILFKYKSYEILFITNPPIVYLISNFLPNKFSVLMWDVYPDMLKIYNITESNIIYKIWSRLNKMTFKRVRKVYSIGENLSKLISKYVVEEKIVRFNLWTALSQKSLPEVNNNIFIKNHQLDGLFVVQYSGNIGTSHNVEVLLELAKLLVDHDKIIIQIIGRGNKKSSFEYNALQLRLKNIFLLPFQSDEIFPHSLAAASLGVVVLDDRVSQGSVPSKTYNLMKAKKPILYIASKDSELNIYSEIYKNGQCFNCNQIKEMAEFIVKLSQDANYYQILSNNSYKASLFYERNNAGTLVSNHLKNLE